MKRLFNWLPAAAAMVLSAGCFTEKNTSHSSAALPRVDGVFYQTVTGTTLLSPKVVLRAIAIGHASTKMPDGRIVNVAVEPDGRNASIALTAKPDNDIIKWGISIGAGKQEYFTGLMERVVDGPQQACWATNITTAMNLRGENVEMILKPTTSVYAPFYLSSAGYGAFVEATLPGEFDFCKADANHVKIAFEGSSFHIKFYTRQSPEEIVRAHALDAGAPFLPPKWMFGPWRWRDEVTQRTNYYDGTPVAGPFNSEFMEDVLMQKAFGIPLSIYWVDRPWGLGENGYDDFKIDYGRLPNFETSIKWLDEQGIKTVLWIGPFFQGGMATNAIAKGWTLASAGQQPMKNNYPLCDFTNPDAKKYWQDGVAKLLHMGVAGFKMDRAEEDIPESGPYKVFDGRSIRENRMTYPQMYLKTAYDVARQYRNDFVCMPRAAYTGSSAYGVFWGGDIGGTQEGLRAEIIAVQRAAVMGYPNWGSDTCGYNDQKMETEVCGRWLEFSCFTPIMEIGPTKNLGFWNFHKSQAYDAELIAIWRLYARLHTRLMDYSFQQANVAHETGLPIVRPLFLVEPSAPAAWSNWWTYLYGPDILVSPLWEKNATSQEVYLPSGSQWQDAWNPGKIYNGGQTITVQAKLHQLPIFIRAGSGVNLGNLNAEWDESVAVANAKPDLKKLDAGVRDWFEKNKAGSLAATPQ